MASAPMPMITVPRRDHTPERIPLPTECTSSRVTGGRHSSIHSEWSERSYTPYVRGE